MSLPQIRIRRTGRPTPEGSEVLINGNRVDGLEGFTWHVETGEADTVTLVVKGRVTVEMIGNQRPGSTD